MADLVDVANALVNAIAAIVYPNGIDQPSIANVPIVIYQGWPNAANLSMDLKNNKVNISVYPQTQDKILPVTIRDWTTFSHNTATLTATVLQNSITINGTNGAPYIQQHLAVVVDQNSIAYLVHPIDTIFDIANGLFNLLAPFYGAISISGNSIYLPVNANIKAARVGTTGTAKRLVRRQEKGFQITIWANCFDQRDPVASAVDEALAGLDRISLPDGSLGIVRYRTSTQDDSLQRQGTYRRDLFYAVEYATYQTETETEITSTQVNTQVNLDGSTIDNPIRSVLS